MFLTQSKKLTLLLALFISMLISVNRATNKQTWPTNREPITYNQLFDSSQFSTFPSSNTFTRVTDIGHAGDERLFIVEKIGLIRIDYPLNQPATFLDIRDKVTSFGYEQGLFSLAFATDFATSGRFFVSYTGITEEVGNALIISSFTLSDNPNQADPLSEQRLLIIKEHTPDHNGGGLIVNPKDGNIYVGIGDDWDKTQAQSNSPKGKVVRLNTANIDWQSPLVFEPWADSYSAVETTILASGLRNPWQITIHPITNDLFIGEVGGAKWEEINLIPNGSVGLNFGWPCLEGPDEADSEPPCDGNETFTLPIHAYDHEQGCTIIGGEFLADGRFIFGDHCTWDVFTLSGHGDGWKVTHIGKLPESRGGLATFGIDYTGQIYAGTIAVFGPYFHLNIPEIIEG